MGLSPPFLRNVVSSGSNLAGGAWDVYGHVELSCCDSSRFCLWGAGELQATMDLLVECERQVAAHMIPKVRLEDLEFATGFHANPRGLLADGPLARRFDFAKVCHIDWMHSALQNGLLTDEV